MKRVKINAVHVADAVADFTDKLWLIVTLDDNGHICLDDLETSKGGVIWDRWFYFSLYEYDDDRAGLEWNESDYNTTSTLNILNRRLVVGEKILYCDQGERFIYQIDNIIDLPA